MLYKTTLQNDRKIEKTKTFVLNNKTHQDKHVKIKKKFKKKRVKICHFFFRFLIKSKPGHFYQIPQYVISKKKKFQPISIKSQVGRLISNKFTNFHFNQTIKENLELKSDSPKAQKLPKLKNEEKLTSEKEKTLTSERSWRLKRAREKLWSYLQGKTAFRV